MVSDLLGGSLISSWLRAHSRYLKSPLFCFTLALIFFHFAKFWEPGIGISSATYGSLARNILNSERWFTPALGPEMYDPFVEHPYLGVWLHALMFKFFGDSAFALRLSATLLGIASVLCLYKVAEIFFDRKVAVYSVLSAMTIQPFMNFFSSGWLDMQMIGFTWLGIFFGVLSLKSKAQLNLVVSGVFFSFAVLVKGVAALAVIPPGIGLLIYHRKSLRNMSLLIASSLAPILLFTLFHFNENQFIFWIEYFQRQFVAQNDTGMQILSAASLSWYLRDLFYHGHFITFFGVLGFASIFKTNKRLALLLISSVLLHVCVYSVSSRHFIQYLLPVFPFLALGAGNFLSKWGTEVKVSRISVYVLALSILYFSISAVLPVEVHAESGKEYRLLFESLEEKSAFSRVYFLGDSDDQKSWEGPASYISWYFKMTPELISTTKIWAGDFDPWGLLVLSPEARSQLPSWLPVFVCGSSEELLALSLQSCKKPSQL